MGIKKKLKIIIHTYELNSLNDKALLQGQWGIKILKRVQNRREETKINTKYDSWKLPIYEGAKIYSLNIHYMRHNNNLFSQHPLCATLQALFKNSNICTCLLMYNILHFSFKSIPFKCDILTQHAVGLSLTLSSSPTSLSLLFDFNWIRKQIRNSFFSWIHSDNLHDDQRYRKWQWRFETFACILFLILISDF